MSKANYIYEDKNKELIIFRDNECCAIKHQAVTNMAH